MRVLFVTSEDEDYMADALLLGLRQLYGYNIIDYPRKEILYSDCRKEVFAKIRGYGFTIYTATSDDKGIDRSNVFRDIVAGRFDLVIIGNIWRQFTFFHKWRKYLNPANTVIVDGEDSPQVYPYAGKWWRRPKGWFLPSATRGFLYFKRELTEDSQFNIWHRLLPKGCRVSIPKYHGLRQTAFSIPDGKIVSQVPPKNQVFANHIVDEGVRRKIANSKSSYVFHNEKDYYTDIQRARFVITTKRAGWDCLRHYEGAANGAVLCFKDLGQKPSTCAPHGLIPGANCLSYQRTEDLQEAVESISEESYAVLASASLQWAQENRSTHRAQEIINCWKSYAGTVR